MDGMKKRWLLLLAFFIAGVACNMNTANAADFDYQAAAEEVSATYSTAYTLYLGMPYADVEKNFRSLPGWQTLEWVDGKRAILLKEASPDGRVLEIINITCQRRQVKKFSIIFLGNDRSVFDVYDIFLYNISQQLGVGREERSGAVRTASWHLDNHFSRVVVARHGWIWPKFDRYLSANVDTSQPVYCVELSRMREIDN